MQSPASACRGCHRRTFLADVGMGFTGLVLGAMLAEEKGVQAAAPVPPRKRAKSVIWLFMNGGVSHLESFDHKPMLDKYAGKTIAETPFKSVQDPDKLKLARVVVVNDANGQQRNRLLATQIGFKKRGKAGLEISDWFPHLGACSEHLAIVRSMYTTDDNHGAQTQFHSGRHMLDGEFPTLGAWVHYGLGTLNKNLPQFISMGVREYWNAKDGHYLGPEHDAVPLRIDPNQPLDYGQPELPRSQTEQQINFKLVGRLNQLRGIEYPDDATLTARIKAYELAARMQTSIPEVLKFSDETAETKKLYGIGEGPTNSFAMQLLAARRLVERGVRFIQIQHGGGGAGAWDAHGGLKTNHANNCRQVDKPIAGLITDLARRGLLDETLIVFGTEFGRTPGTQGSDGRDHHIYGFSVWLAGGGIKGGVVHGATDEIGFHAVENRHYVTDIHATILQCLGLDSRKLEVPGRKRLEIDHGKPIWEILA
ncbi:MAG: DUF1501 domain-containing protein [Gemmataceae bacterium]